MVLLAQHENPFDVISNKLHNNWWTVLQASWTVWPGFQLFNLYFIPVHLRIVALNIWATGWNGFLSFVHNTKGHGKEVEERSKNCLILKTMLKKSPWFMIKKG